MAMSEEQLMQLIVRAVTAAVGATHAGEVAAGTTAAGPGPL